MEICSGKLWYFIILTCSAILSSVLSALQLSDCKEFKVVPPDQYDRNTSSADDTDKRPLGYEYDIAKYLGVQSGGNLTNPCAYLRYLTARNVEVMVQTFVPGKSICVRDNGNPPISDCGQGAANLGCWTPSQDTMIYEFYCDTTKGCDTDVQFWYRLTPSPVGDDVDDWCRGRDSEFPENLLTAPPPVEDTKPTMKSAASSLHSWNICFTFLLFQLVHFSSF